ncbi:MAG: chemotaxis protein CheW [Deltaproteobacteria bacterium]|nr:chemotaxis protein CheW [Deltaproteobacteria bacterium]MBF0524282.1 chemotaxis protein CheW [Deltaproteobacteria bacterium]
MTNRGPEEGRKNEPDSVRQLVTFKIAQEEFGVDILKVREIIRLPQITLVPNSPDFFKGIINLRGKIIPVVDLITQLNMPVTAPVDSKKSKILIIEIDNRISGFIVDSVTAVLKIPADSVEPPPEIVVARLGSEYVEGVSEHGGRFISILNFNAVLQTAHKIELARQSN